MSSPLLEVRDLTKRFPSVVALNDVDFSVRHGEIHALMGENGAGKSTLIKVITGVHPRDGGEVRLNEQLITPSSPRDAETLGISTVYQEVQLIQHLSVAENILLGRQSRRWGIIDWQSVRQRATEILGQLDLEIDVRRELGSLSIATQQMVAIARAIELDAKLLILDEPTSSLDEHEVQELFTVMQRLRDRGYGIVFVTHFLDQVYEITDCITILRNGELVGEYQTAELPRIKLIEKMLGFVPASESKMQADAITQDLSSPSDNEVNINRSNTSLLETQNLARGSAVQSINFQVKAGETLGLAGLLGSGRTETARLLFGLDQHTDGKLLVGNVEQPHWSVRQAIAAGIGFCPEDRQAEGVIASLSVRENILLAMQASRGLFSTLPLRQQNQIAEHYIQILRIKTPSAEVAVSSLSGGNQQKVLLARWLAMSPKLMLLDEPTRGIDVGAKSEIESLVESLRSSGMAFVFISSELDEVVRNCQRVVVLRDRQQVGELRGSAIDEQSIMHLVAESHA